MIGLGEEYTKRYNKKHLSITKCEDALKIEPFGIDYNGFKQPPQCMPDEFKDECSVKAYWNYYIGEKHNVANKDEEIYKQAPVLPA
jgi:hypothetical protein